MEETKEAEAEEKEESGEKKEGKKLYKGEVKKVKDLEIESPTPVQPLKQRFTRMGYEAKVPPTFVLTRFSQAYGGGRRMMHYFDPKNSHVTQIDVPDDFELNVLSGRRAQELSESWDSTVKSQLVRVAQRIGCTVGSDPEIFAVDKKGVVPAWTFLPEKKKPVNWKHREYAGTAYWDGFQAEFTTTGAVTCLIELTKELRGGLLAIHSRLPKGAKLSTTSVLPVDGDVLRNASDEHVAFGCAPSKNAYGLKGAISEGRVTPYRFAGGHIHLGLNDTDKRRIPEIVKALDAVVGVGCVSLFASMDSPIRRQFYGLAGEYRTPEHGVEYRVLSNAWLSHPVLVHMVYDLTRAVAGAICSGIRLQDLWGAKEEDTIKAIQESNVELARKILVENQRAFTQLLYISGKSYSNQTGQVVAWDTWTKGAEHLIEDPKDITRNWFLESSDNAWDVGAVRIFSTAAIKREREGKRV